MTEPEGCNSNSIKLFSFNLARERAYRQLDTKAGWSYEHSGSLTGSIIRLSLRLLIMRTGLKS
ncbi:MAG TPA: hypothetical protein VGK06_08710 [Methanosarcina sp.]